MWEHAESCKDRPEKRLAAEIDRLRDLLRKYIRHVDAEEGTCFLYHFRGWLGSAFTPEEWTEMQTLRDEALKD